MYEELLAALTSPPHTLAKLLSTSQQERTRWMIWQLTCMCTMLVNSCWGVYADASPTAWTLLIHNSIRKCRQGFCIYSMSLWGSNSQIQAWFQYMYCTSFGQPQSDLSMISAYVLSIVGKAHSNSACINKAVVQCKNGVCKYHERHSQMQVWYYDVSFDNSAASTRIVATPTRLVIL